MILSHSEFERFERMMALDSVRAIAAWFAADAPDIRMRHDTETAWLEHIHGLVSDAQSDGLSIERELRAHVAISLHRGEDFWRRPEVRSLIAQPHLNTPTLRLMAVLHRLDEDSAW